jgi:hypothetical protein
MNFFSYFEMRPSNIYFNCLQTAQNSKFGDILTSVKKKNAKHLVQISSPRSDPYVFLDADFFVTAASGSSILWLWSDRQLFAVGTNGRTGGQCAGLHITAAPQNL